MPGVLVGVADGTSIAHGDGFGVSRPGRGSSSSQPSGEECEIGSRMLKELAEVGITTSSESGL
jgi:hypothetical protein